MLTKQSEMQSQVILISSLNKGVLNSYHQMKNFFKKVELLKRKKEYLEKSWQKFYQYMKDWKAGIEKYQGNIISQIEPPFVFFVPEFYNQIEEVL